MITLPSNTTDANVVSNCAAVSEPSFALLDTLVTEPVPTITVATVSSLVEVFVEDFLDPPAVQPASIATAHKVVRIFFIFKFPSI